MLRSLRPALGTQGLMLDCMCTRDVMCTRGLATLLLIDAQIWIASYLQYIP